MEEQKVSPRDSVGGWVGESLLPRSPASRTLRIWQSWEAEGPEQTEVGHLSRHQIFGPRSPRRLIGPRRPSRTVLLPSPIFTDEKAKISRLPGRQGPLRIQAFWPQGPSASCSLKGWWSLARPPSPGSEGHDYVVLFPIWVF